MHNCSFFKAILYCWMNECTTTTKHKGYFAYKIIIVICLVCLWRSVWWYSKLITFIFVSFSPFFKLLLLCLTSKCGIFSQFGLDHIDRLSISHKRRITGKNKRLNWFLGMGYCIGRFIFILLLTQTQMV